MLERLFNAVLLLVMAAIAWLAAWAGRNTSRGLAVLLALLGGLAVVLVVVTFAWSA